MHSLESESYLTVQLDGKNVGTILISDSPDHDYLTLENIGKTTNLKKGEHTLTIKADGELPVLLDNIVLQPVKEFATFSIKKNKLILLERDFNEQTIEISNYNNHQIQH